MSDMTPVQAAAWLDEHQRDTCEYEMGVCLSGCVGGCPPAYCISDRHKGDVAPVWPCRVACRALGVKSAKAYWDAEYTAMLAYYEAHDPNAAREDR